MKADNQKRFPEVEIPQSSPEYIYTAGYYRCADNIVPDSEKARNNFYVTESRNDDTVYVYPWVYSRDLSVQEITSVFPCRFLSSALRVTCLLSRNTVI